MEIFLSCLLSSRMSPIWVPWVVAFSSTVLRLDASMTQGRDSPGKNIVISFRYRGTHWHWGERPFPSGPGSSSDRKQFWLQRIFLREKLSLPLYHMKWSGGERDFLSQSHWFNKRETYCLLRVLMVLMAGHLENCEKLRQAENSHCLSARSLMIVTAFICDCFFMHIWTWLRHLTFLSLCNMVRLYQAIWQTGEIECVMPILRLPGTYAYWYLSSWEVKLCKHEMTGHSENIFIRRKQDTTFLKQSPFKCQSLNAKEEQNPRVGEGGCEEIIVLGEQKPLWAYNFC